MIVFNVTVVENKNGQKTITIPKAMKHFEKGDKLEMSVSGKKAVLTKKED